ncbi:MAG: glycosyltransferase family 4 protein [Thermoplasmata archaeon]|nr:glycosyltransferase family 4 protein [Thermoplasmata archaeon]
MRVLLVGTGVQPIPPPGYGGVERTIAELARALRDAGEDPVVVNRVRAGRSVDEYWFAWELPKLMRAQQYDVVHASTPVVAQRLSMARIPFVYTTHSRHWFECSGARQRWGLYLERRAVRRAARAIALTDTLRRRIATLVPSARSPQVIPIGVDTDAFRPDPERRTGRRVLGVGIVRPFKRWELAARALRGTGWELRIAGPVPDAAYADLVRRAGDRVELLGEVSEPRLRELYAESDVLVHPSRVELLAGVVLQGLSAGLPVLGAEPIVDLVETGVTGAIAPVGSPEEELVRFLHTWAVRLRDEPDTRRSMGAHAREVALTRFAWTNVAEAHRSLYRAVVAGGVNRR